MSVTEVHWRIIANLGFKFRSQFTRIAIAVHVGASTELFIVQWVRGKGSSPGRVEGSSRAMLATARPTCLQILQVRPDFASWRPDFCRCDANLPVL